MRLRSTDVRASIPRPGEHMVRHYATGIRLAFKRALLQPLDRLGVDLGCADVGPGGGIHRGPGGMIGDMDGWVDGSI